MTRDTTGSGLWRLLTLGGLLFLCLPGLARAGATHEPRGPLGVLVTPSCRSCGPSGADGFSVILSDASGRVVARARVPSPQTRVRQRGFGGDTASLPLPGPSVAGSHVYVLGGDGWLRALARDGSITLVRQLLVGPGVRAGFAVSPDERYIAVGLLAFNGCSAAVSGSGVPCRNDRTTLYVEDLRGGHHHEIFTSEGVYEWPVGWHAGALVVAVSQLPGNQYPAANPYAAFNGYHVVDASTGHRLENVCVDPVGTGRTIALGTLSSAGTLCLRQTARGSTLGLQSWEGREHVVVSGLTSYSGALTSDGRRVALTGSNGHLLVWDGAEVRVFPLSGMPLGWLDGTHLLIQSMGGAASCEMVEFPLARVSPVQGLPAGVQVSFFGTLPGGL